MLQGEMNHVSERDDQKGNNYDQSNQRSMSSSSQWSSYRNPRIVHASRFSGTKDRHSKVCTIRGLRDRRIRLSVPTALQLYNLQERLNLNQPSKVIDWLLQETKHEIHNLPPLHFPPPTFPNSNSISNPINPNSSLDLNQTHTNPMFPNNVMIPNNPCFNWEFCFPFTRHGSQTEGSSTLYSGQLPVMGPNYNSSNINGPRVENDQSRKYRQFLNSQMLIQNNLVATTSLSSMNPLSSMFNLHPQRQEISHGSTSSDS